MFPDAFEKLTGFYGYERDGNIVIREIYQRLEETMMDFGF